MNPLIAFCGLDCAHCDARTATIHNDDALRQQVAHQWSEWNHVDIHAASINCLGCRVEGAKCYYCEKLCPIRKCILKRGYAHCGECPDMENCAMLYEIQKNAPETKANLRDTEVPYFLAQELTDGYLQGKEYIYATPQGYFAAIDQPEAFAEYDATFPVKEKQKLPTQLFAE